MTSFYASELGSAVPLWLTASDLENITALARKNSLPADGNPETDVSESTFATKDLVAQVKWPQEAKPADELHLTGHCKLAIQGSVGHVEDPLFVQHANGNRSTTVAASDVQETRSDVRPPLTQQSSIRKDLASDVATEIAKTTSDLTITSQVTSTVDKSKTLNAKDGCIATNQSFTLYGRSVRRAALGGVDADNVLNSATSLHVRLGRTLAAAPNASQVLQVLDHSLAEFDSFHCVLAVHRLAKHARLQGAPTVLGHSKWPVFVQRLRQVVQDASSEPRQLASIVWAFANLRFGDWPLLDAVVARAVDGTNWDPMSLSLLPQSFAMLHAKHAPLLSSVANKVRQGLSEAWNPGDVSRVAWALARLLHRDDNLFRDISCKLVARLPECSPGIVAQSIWAFATVGPRETAESHLFPRMASIMRGPVLADYTTAHLAMIAWAFAAVLYRPVELLDEIGNMIPLKSEQLNPQDISMTVWSYATLLAPQRRVFDFLASAAISAVKSFNAQDLANTAWAFATAGEYSADLLDALGDEACQRPQDFNNQHSAMLIWAYVTLKHYHSGMYSMVGELADVDRSSWSSAKLFAYALAGLPRLSALLGTRSATLRIAASLVSALLERSRDGLGEPDDAQTIHDAVYPLLDPAGGGTELLDPSAWREVESMVELQRERLRVLSRQPVFEAVLPRPDAETLIYNLATVREYQNAVQSLGLRGLGSAQTWKLLQEFGVKRVETELATSATKALRRPELNAISTGRGERANRCYWQATIHALAPDGSSRVVAEPGRTQDSTVVPYREDCAGLVAVKLSHDHVSHRAWDCEFRAMARTAAAARAMLAGLSDAHVQCLLDHGTTADEIVADGVNTSTIGSQVDTQDIMNSTRSWRGETCVKGFLGIYMTEVPCLSCVCAMLQFRRRFPSFDIAVGWDGLPPQL